MAQVAWLSFHFSLGLSSLRNQTETLATLRRLVELRLLKWFNSPTPYSFFLIASVFKPQANRMRNPRFSNSDSSSARFSKAKRGAFTSANVPLSSKLLNQKKKTQISDSERQETRPFVCASLTHQHEAQSHLMWVSTFPVGVFQVDGWLVCG